MLANAAEAHMQAQARVQALQIQRTFLQTYEYGQGLSRFVLYLRARATAGELTAAELRQRVAEQMRSAVLAKPDLLGLSSSSSATRWTAPTASSSARTRPSATTPGASRCTGCKASPASCNRWSARSRSSPTPRPAPAAAPTTLSTPAPDSRRACLLEPYFDDASGTRRLVTSVAFPLIENGKVIAVVGLDISLDALQRSALDGSAQLFDGAGQLGILSTGGVVAGYSADANALGKRLDQALPEGADAVLGSLREAKARSLVDEQRIRVLEPLEPIPGAAPWGVLATVPQRVLLAPAETLQKELDAERLASSALEFGLGSGAALLGVLLIWFAAFRITRPLQGLTRMLEAIAQGEGDLTGRLAVHSRDELGKLAAAFNRFVERIHASMGEVASATGGSTRSPNGCWPPPTPRCATPTSRPSAPTAWLPRSTSWVPLPRRSPATPPTPRTRPPMPANWPRKASRWSARPSPPCMSCPARSAPPAHRSRPSPARRSTSARSST